MQINALLHGCGQHAWRYVGDWRARSLLIVEPPWGPTTGGAAIAAHPLFLYPLCLFPNISRKNYKKFGRKYPFSRHFIQKI
jgi:hypothetical protein